MKITSIEENRRHFFANKDENIIECASGPMDWNLFLDIYLYARVIRFPINKQPDREKARKILSVMMNHDNSLLLLKQAGRIMIKYPNLMLFDCPDGEARDLFLTMYSNAKLLY